MLKVLIKRWEGRVPEATRRLLTDVGLLLLRVGAAALMLTHGYDKLTTFDARLEKGFADPIGLGSTLSLTLATFAEFFCALAVLVGLATRLAVIPLAITMSVAAIIVHADDPFAVKEKALLFLVFWVGLFFTGPGRFSLDRVIQDRVAKGEKKG